MAKSFALNIRGYFRDEVRNQFPHYQGIYFIYRGILNHVTKTCTLTALLYIGETNDLYDRLNEHPNRTELMEALEDGESLFYTYALTDLNEAERKRVEASLIYELAPSKNMRTIQEFPYSETILEVFGDRHAFIPEIVKAPSY